MAAWTKIIIPVGGHTEAEVKEAITKSFISWDRLLPEIKHLITMKGNEVVVGLEVANDGVTAVIEYKDK